MKRQIHPYPRTWLLALLALVAAASLARAAHAESQKPQTIDCIIVSGQSNAVGADADPELLPADEVDQQILFWFRTGDPPPDEHDSTSEGKWTHLQYQPVGNPIRDKKIKRQYGNFHFPKGGFGPEIGMGRILFHAEHKPLAIIKAAWSGTGMQKDWNRTGPGGECYRGLVAEVKAAREAAKSQGITLHFRAFVWVQGESDANPHDTPLYTNALGDMLASLRKEFDAPALPALIAINTHYSDMKKVAPKVQGIIDAQKALAAKDAHCVYVDTEGATLANTSHFDAAGTVEVGRRFAEALLAYEKPKATKE